MTATLVDIDTVKDQLHKVSDSDVPALQMHLDAASNMIQSMCLPLTPDTVTDYCDGGSVAVQLSRYPVTAVTSVTAYDSSGPTVLVEAGGVTSVYDGWSLDASAGMLRRVGHGVWPVGFGNIEVVYTVGPDAVPPEVQRAAVTLTQHLWQFRRITGTAGQSGNASTDGMGFSPSFAVPNQVIEMLRDWLKPARIA